MLQHTTHAQNHHHPGQPIRWGVQKALADASLSDDFWKLVHTAPCNGANQDTVQDTVDLLNDLPDKNYYRPTAVAR